MNRTENSKQVIKKKKNMKRLKYGLFFLFCFLILQASYYFLTYYPMGETSKQIYEQLPLREKESDITLSVNDPKATILFYPGAKVDEKAYLPLMQQLQQKGMEIKIYQMPLHFAIFGVEKAKRDTQHISKKRPVFMMGHSLGGVMAAKFAQNYPKEITGLILLGAYPYGEYPLDKTLSIYGSKEKTVRRKNLLWQKKGLETFEIEGANHSGFGDYGLQKGDPLGEISPRQQWRQTNEKICQFIEKRIDLENY